MVLEEDKRSSSGQTFHKTKTERYVLISIHTAAMTADAETNEHRTTSDIVSMRLQVGGRRIKTFTGTSET